MWLVAEGKRLEYAEEVYAINEAQDGKKITLLCPTVQIRSRGDTLNRPTLTVVCLTHFKNPDRGPMIHRNWKLSWMIYFQSK
jgi:hypothetical protein